MLLSLLAWRGAESATLRVTRWLLLLLPTVTYFDTYKLVSNSFSGQTRKEANHLRRKPMHATCLLTAHHTNAPRIVHPAVVLYSRGTPAPTNLSHAVDLAVEIPVTHVAVTSTTFIPWIEV